MESKAFMILGLRLKIKGKNMATREDVIAYINENESTILGNIRMRHIIRNHVNVDESDGSSGQFIIPEESGYNDTDYEEYIRGLLAQALDSISLENIIKIYWDETINGDLRKIELVVNSEYVLGKKSNMDDTKRFRIIIENDGITTAYPF